MKMRTFHIWDFPKDKIKIKLDEEFRKQFFDALRKDIGSARKLSKVFKYNISSFSRWWLGKEFIPLPIMLKMYKPLSEKYKMFSFSRLEKNVTHIKSNGMYNRQAITNPNLPIREDGRLLKLVAHLLGDAYEGQTLKNYSKRGCYCNVNNVLIEDFLQSLTVFGNVPTCSWFNKKKESNSVILSTSCDISP
ncbi:MAG: hypothetical protein V1870_01450 [Candidatus Aenigmatarchaeota archaeon]